MINIDISTFWDDVLQFPAVVLSLCNVIDVI